MTAMYDGVLTITPKGVSPCCERMHVAVIRKTIRAGTRAKKPVLLLADEGTISHCPFCGKVML